MSVVAQFGSDQNCDHNHNSQGIGFNATTLINVFCTLTFIMMFFTHIVHVVLGYRNRWAIYLYLMLINQFHIVVQTRLINTGDSCEGPSTLLTARLIFHA